MIAGIPTPVLVYGGVVLVVVIMVIAVATLLHRTRSSDMGYHDPSWRPSKRTDAGIERLSRRRYIHGRIEDPGADL